MSAESLIGKFVIVRSNLTGVLFGKLVEKRDLELSLENVRKIYYWEGACAVEQIAIDGVDIQNSKITVEVDAMTISEFIQIIPCSDKAYTSIKTAPIWKI